ncbi:MAG: flagellar motor protein MotB [Lachnospiraceae bacterium]|nr:flagellar motor protein MotB [Lachnospiraceae bacterium]
MARMRKEEGGSKGSPAWMSTFSDLMNLLLCFFVLLFSMSTVDQEKFEEVVASLQTNFSIFDGGGSSFTDGVLISSGVSQLTELNDFYESMGQSQDAMNQQIAENEQEYEEKKEQEMLEASEKMGEEISAELKAQGLNNGEVDIQIEAQYVMLTLNGSVLFDSGSAVIRDESLDFVSKIGDILKKYDKYDIQIIGHTDTVPQSSSNVKYSDNMELSQGRAYALYQYLKDNKDMDVTTMGCMGRGETAPIASNDTPEGRARNRRVEVKIFNEYSSSGVLN